MAAGRPLREIKRRLEEQLLDEQIVLDRIAEEDGRVDVGIVEGMCIRLVLEEGGAVNAEHLQRQSSRASKPRVGSSVRRAVGEADQRVVYSGFCIDPLRIFSGQSIENLDLCPD
jgi:hypothetical protein